MLRVGIVCKLMNAPGVLQVAVDVPRTAPGVPFFHQPRLQKSLERILYIWGIRYSPAVIMVTTMPSLSLP